jgi:hypothetical protein
MSEDAPKDDQSPNVLRISFQALSTSSAQLRPRRLKLATETTPHFDEMMCSLGKLVLAFNILEQELKAATAYLLDPQSCDLLRSEVADRKKLKQRINHVKRLCETKLSKQSLESLNACLDKAKDFPDSRHFRAHAILYSEVDAEAEFHFRKIEEKLESQLGNPVEMKERVQILQTWTEEFASLFKDLFPDYSSWYLSQIPQ